MKKFLSFFLVLSLLVSAAGTAAVTANATPLQATFTWNQTEYYEASCRSDAIILTLTAENYTDETWAGVYLADETPSAEREAIKYAVLSAIQAQAVNLKNTTIWLNGEGRSEHQNLPAGSYKVCVFEGDDYTVLAQDSFTVKGHNVKYIPGIAATCEKPGLSEGKQCTVCSKTLVSQAPTRPLGHTWSAWSVSKTATCTEAGTKVRTCSRSDCQKKDFVEIPATGVHSYAYILETPSTPTHAGTLAYKCSMCLKRANAFETDIVIAQIHSLSLSKTTYSYDGTFKKPAVTVKDYNGAAISSSDYTVSYSSNFGIGKAKVVVSFKNNYEGTLTKTFNIVPAKPAVKVNKVTAAAVTLKWKKVNGATYYKVFEYKPATKKYTLLAKTTNLYYSQTKKSAASTYYYLVRAYTTDASGATFASEYTAADCVKAVTLCKPPAPKASASGKTVSVKWAKISGAKTYRVYEYNTKTKKYTILVKSTTALSAKLTKQSKGTHYYLVRAFNAAGAASAYSTANHVKAVVK